jgi:hypothetical protein
MMRYFALVMHDKAADDPHALLRYNGHDPVQVWTREGWLDRLQLMRFVREETGALEITRAQADAVIALWKERADATV